MDRRLYVYRSRLPAVRLSAFERTSLYTLVSRNLECPKDVNRERSSNLPLDDSLAETGETDYTHIVHSYLMFFLIHTLVEAGHQNLRDCDSDCPVDQQVCS